MIGGELAGGLGLLSGVLWQWAALGLIPIMAGAYLSDTLPTVRARNRPACRARGRASQVMRYRVLED